MDLTSILKGSACMANVRMVPHDSSKRNDPLGQQLGTENEDSAMANEPATHSATRRKLIATAGLGLRLAGLIRTHDVLSMAQEHEAVHQTVCAHGEPACRCV